MRDYNFRVKCKKKEQENRKEIYNNRGYFPTIPNRGIGENGEEYYMEGLQSKRKKSLKRTSNKKVRNYKLDGISNGRNYKKVFDLQWNWY